MSKHKGKDEDTRNAEERAADFDKQWQESKDSADYPTVGSLTVHRDKENNR